MDDEMRILHEAMVVKERLRVLADLQSTYWDELISRGFEQSVAEQLMLDWSRHAYGLTFRAVGDPAAEVSLDELLGSIDAGSTDDASSAGSNASDPSSVPPGEPWLQLVEDLDAPEIDDESASEQSSRDDRAA